MIMSNCWKRHTSSVYMLSVYSNLERLPFKIHTTAWVHLLYEYTFPPRCSRIGQSKFLSNLPFLLETVGLLFVLPFATNLAHRALRRQYIMIGNGIQDDGSLEDQLNVNRRVRDFSIDPLERLQLQTSWLFIRPFEIILKTAVNILIYYMNCKQFSWYPRR